LVQSPPILQMREFSIFNQILLSLFDVSNAIILDNLETKVCQNV